MSAKAILMSAAAFLALASSAVAQSTESAPATMSQPPAMVQPADVDDCLAFVETVLVYAVDADLLDDQIEEAETELEKMEAACYSKRFDDALEFAKAIVTIVSSNK